MPSGLHRTYDGVARPLTSRCDHEVGVPLLRAFANSLPRALRLGAGVPPQMVTHRPLPKIGGEPIPFNGLRAQGHTPEREEGYPHS